MAKFFTQCERICKYLKKKGVRGATNFEMMTKLAIVDTRKRISEINSEPWTFGCIIASKWERKNNTNFKRYYWIEYESK